LPHRAQYHSCVSTNITARSAISLAARRTSLREAQYHSPPGEHHSAQRNITHPKGEYHLPAGQISLVRQHEYHCAKRNITRRQANITARSGISLTQRVNITCPQGKYHCAQHEYHSHISANITVRTTTIAPHITFRPR
jgi:hypothetical protein